MRIALVGAEHEESLAVRYIRGALERDGHEVVQIVFNEPEELTPAARQLAGSRAQLAGLSLVFTARAHEFVDLAARARQLGYRGMIVAGGHFAAFNAEELLRDVPALDAIACGEGERIMCQLAAALDRPEGVPGLVLRDGDGVRRAPAASKPADLDELAWPTRKSPFDEYLGLPVVNLLASRGCGHACAFCSIAAWHRLCGGDRLRLRRPEAVAEEMAALYSQGVRIFNFHDDNFLLRDRAAGRERIRALRRALGERGVGRIAFAIKCRPDDVERELFEELREMGLFRLFLGVEAGSADALRRLGRGQSLDDNIRALELVNELELHTCFNLLLLNPDSTLEDLATNVAFLRRHPGNPMNFCRTEVYAGTPLERRLRRQGRLLGDYWGRHYRIADDRVQRAFEIICPLFDERNFTSDGLHHLAMQLDYEHQILAHFFGTRPGLRRRVKELIVEINHNTCAYLEEIVAAVATSTLDEDPQIVSRLLPRLLADSRRLGYRTRRLIEEIRGRAARRSSGRWAMRAAAAGLVATVSLGGAACRKPGEGIGSHATERVAAPLDGDPALVRDLLGRELLPRVAPLLSEPAQLEVKVSLDGEGKIARCAIRNSRTGEPVICPMLEVAFSGEGTARRTFNLVYAEREVAEVLRGVRPPRDAGVADSPPSHMKEMAPPPRPRVDARTTHMHERAPRPRRDARLTHPTEMVAPPRPLPPGDPAPRPLPPQPQPKPRPKHPKRPPTHPAEMAPQPRPRSDAGATYPREMAAPWKR